MWRFIFTACLLAILLLFDVDCSPVRDRRHYGGRTRGRENSGNDNRYNVDQVRSEVKFICESELLNEWNETLKLNATLGDQTKAIVKLRTELRSRDEWPRADATLKLIYQVESISKSKSLGSIINKLKVLEANSKQGKGRHYKHWHKQGQSGRNVDLRTDSTKECRKILAILHNLNRRMTAAVNENLEYIFKLTRHFNRWRSEYSTERHNPSTRNHWNSWSSRRPWWDSSSTKNPSWNSRGTGPRYPVITRRPWWDSSSTKNPWWNAESTENPWDSWSTKRPWWDSGSTENPWWNSESTKNPWWNAGSTENPWRNSESTKNPWWDSGSTENPWWNSESTKNPWWNAESTENPWRNSESTKNPWWDSWTTKNPWWNSESTEIPWRNSESTKSPWWDSWTTENPWWNSGSTEPRYPVITRRPWWDSSSTKNPWWNSESTENPWDSWTTRKPWWNSESSENPWDSWTTKRPRWDSWTTKNVDNGESTDDWRFDMKTSSISIDSFTTPGTTSVETWTPPTQESYTERPNATASVSEPDTNARNCLEIKNLNPRARSGLYQIKIASISSRPVQVYCDMNTTSGGWLIIQRRRLGSTNFYRTWIEYVNGFGYPDADYWIGLEKLSALTGSMSYALRIEMTDHKQRRSYAEYNNFVIGNNTSNYKLVSVGRYSGTSGDSLSYHVGQPFSTFDSDNDAVPDDNCAQQYRGAWWYKYCVESNLNGEFFSGITWRTLTGYQNSLQAVTMMIRPLKSIG